MSRIDKSGALVREVRVSWSVCQEGHDKAITVILSPDASNFLLERSGTTHCFVGYTITHVPEIDANFDSRRREEGRDHFLSIGESVGTLPQHSGPGEEVVVDVVVQTYFGVFGLTGIRNGAVLVDRDLSVADCSAYATVLREPPA
jgi:hypothetical protein